MMGLYEAGEGQFHEGDFLKFPDNPWGGSKGNCRKLPGHTL
jgi:hypothetical protein